MAKSAVVTVKVTDTKVAELIDEGSRLKKQYDKIGARLGEIKDALADLPSKTKHVTEKNNYVTISESDTFTEISPVQCRNKLKELRLGPKFPLVVTVKIGELQKYLSEEAISGLRKKVGSSRSYKFG